MTTLGYGVEITQLWENDLNININIANITTNKKVLNIYMNK